MQYIDFGLRSYLKKIRSRADGSHSEIMELLRAVELSAADVVQKLSEKYTRKHIVFSYYLYDAWFHEICRTDLISGHNHQVVCHHYTEDSEVCLTVGHTVIDDYYEIIHSYADTFRAENFCMDENDLLDGYEHRIFMADEMYGYYFPCSNLYFHQSEDFRQDSVLLSALSEIFILLKAAGVDECYLALKRSLN